MKKILQALLYIVFFLVCFVFFVYMTFPFGVVKEAISEQIRKSTDFSVRFGAMESRFPLGLEANDITVFHDSGAQMSLETIEAGLSLLPLIWGSVSVDLLVGSRGGGELELESSLPLIGLATSQNVLPTRLVGYSDKFSISDITAFFMQMASDAPGPNMVLLAPLLQQISVNGLLKLDVDLDMDGESLSSSTGKFVLGFDEFQILFDPDLNVPSQKFANSKIVSTVRGGNLTINGPDTGFESADLSLDLDGKVDLGTDFARSNVDLNLSFQLKNDLQQQYGYIVNSILGNSGQGASQWQIRGPLTSPSPIKL